MRTLIFSRILPVLILTLLFFPNADRRLTATQPLCPGTPPSMISIGNRARVTYTDGSSTNLRSASTTNSDILLRMPEGYEFEVIGGAQCADGYTWWQIRTIDGLVGWVAEGNENGYFVEPLFSTALTDSISPTAFISELEDVEITFFKDDAIWYFNPTSGAISTIILLSQSDFGLIEICPQWSYDGRYLAFTHNNNLQGDYRLVIFDSLLSQLTMSVDNVSKWFDWSHSQNTVVYGVGVNETEKGLRIADVTNTITASLVASPSGYPLAFPIWSPDDSRISFYDVRHIEGFGEFYLVDLNTSTYFQPPFSQFEWSPDSSAVVYSDDFRLFTSQSNGASAVRLVGGTEFQVIEPVWSPSGQYIAFNTIADSDTMSGYRPDKLWVIDLTNNSLRQLTDIAISSKTWSPSSTHLLVETYFDQTVQLIALDGAPSIDIGRGRCASWRNRVSSTIPEYQNTYVIVTQETHLYREPSISSNILTSLSPNYTTPSLASHTVIGKNGNSTWLQVQLSRSRGGYIGWVCRAHTVDSGDLFLVPRTSESREDCTGNSSETVNYETRFQTESEREVAQAVANALYDVIQQAPDLSQTAETTIFLVEAATDGVSLIQIGCTSLSNLEYLDRVVGTTISRNLSVVAGDVVCTWGGGIALLLSTLNPIGLVPILIEPDKYVDPFLDPINKVTWSFPISCFFFPDAAHCAANN